MGRQKVVPSELSSVNKGAKGSRQQPNMKPKSLPIAKKKLDNLMGAYADL